MRKYPIYYTGEQVEVHSISNPSTLRKQIYIPRMAEAPNEQAKENTI